MRKVVMAAFLVLLALPVFVICQSNKMELEVRRIDEEFHKAFRLEDAAALENLLTENFFWTHSTGNIQTKAIILTNVRSGKTAYESIENDDVQVYLYKDSAVVNGRSTRQYPGKDTFWIRYTRLCKVRRKVEGGGVSHKPHSGPKYGREVKATATSI